ncbi:MAG: FkbM family methyltransferase [Candidatus Nanopelagicales bacterium]
MYLNSSEILLSVALVTRNRPESLERCLKSLRSQNIQPFEVVVSDDSDPIYQEATKNIAKQWDCRYIKGQCRGLYANRNHVALNCQGTHIRTMDDDHEFPDKHIEDCLIAIKSDPESVWIIGEYLPNQHIVNPPHPCPGQLHPRGFSYFPKDTQNCWAISDGASIYPRKIFDSGLRFVEFWKFGASYLEWGSRLHHFGYRIRHLSSTYIIHYLELNNRSFIDEEMQQSSSFFAMMCFVFLYQNSFKNKSLFYFEIFKQLSVNPSLNAKALKQSLIYFFEFRNMNPNLTKQMNNYIPLRIYPLWLREKLYYRFFSKEAYTYSHLFDSVSLEFAPNTSLKLEPRDVGHQVIAFCGFYELELTRKIVQLAKQGGLFVDVGANYGYFSCLWAASNPENRVIAFEASPRNAVPLRENIAKNHLEAQVDVYDIALGKEVGNLPFSFMSDEQTGWGGLSLKEEMNTINVPVVTLDQFWTELAYQPIDVLKIDTEGADTWVLEGASQLLRDKRIKHIFFEENEVRMSALDILSETAKKLLVSCGYKLRPIGEREWYATIQ